MRAVVQRVSEASVIVENKIVGEINLGFLILLGVGQEDTEEDIQYLTSKIAQLRVFRDEQGKMNLNILGVEGNCLVISQFTLYASTKKGNRPSFIDAAPPVKAKDFYEKFCEHLSTQIHRKVERGIFAADMKIKLINDGPVTIIYDSKQK